MSGVYWGLTAMDLMGQLHRMNKPEVLGFVKSCQNPCGGFGPTEHHDPHLLYTLSAIQVYTHYTSTYIVKCVQCSVLCVCCVIRCWCCMGV